MSEVDDADGIPVTAAATFCATLVDTWVTAGLRHAVISPGSRSTPMALALADSPLRVHVCVDERSAGFVALGIARATRWPVPVLTTSGTATTNLHPAVVEAHQDCVPLIVCTADRPPELHGVGAPQTIDQQKLFGSAVRAFIDAGVPDDADSGGWREMATTTWFTAAGSGPGSPGPVQLNLPFRDPLVGRPGSVPKFGAESSLGWGDQLDVIPDVAELMSGRRVLVVAGPPTPTFTGAMLLDLAERLNWPLLIEPRTEPPRESAEGATRGAAFAGSDDVSVLTMAVLADPSLADEEVGQAGGVPVHHALEVVGCHRADLILRSATFASTAQPDVVIRLGALPASKVLGAWLDSLDAFQIGADAYGRRFDPGDSLDHFIADVDWFVDDLDQQDLDPAPPEWLELWTAAEREAEAVLEAELADGPLTEPATARLVTEVARDQQAELFVSSSMPIRDVEWFGVPDGPAIHANRGANGIDGITSTAAGVALGSGHRTFALLGDLAFLHDTNGLLVLNSEQPDLTLVVVDNGGGGIFHFLPQRDALDAARFERLYGTPQNVDLAAVAEAHGVPAQRCDDRDAFEAALRATTKGPRVLVVTTDRDANVAEHRRLQDLVVAAVDASLPPPS